MAHDTFTLTGTHTQLNGTPWTGTIEIIPTGITGAVIKDTAGNIVMSGRVKIDLDETGSYSVTLPDPRDTTNLNPAGFGYTVVAKLYGHHPPAVSFGGEQITAHAVAGVLNIEDVTSVDPSTFTPTATYVEAAELAALETAVAGKADTASLATVATSGAYTDLTAKPTIPTTPGEVGAEPAGLSAATDAELAATYVRQHVTAESATGIALPAGLAFKKRWAKRHLFDLGITLGKFDPYLTDWTVGSTTLLPVMGLIGTAPTASRSAGLLRFTGGAGTGECTTKMGQLFPFAVYDLHVSAASSGTAEASIGFRYGGADHFRVLARTSDGRVVLEGRKGGVDQTAVTLGTAPGLTAPYTLRVQVNRSVLIAWIIDSNGLPDYIGQATIPLNYDLGDMDDIAGWTWGAGARLATGETVTIRSAEAKLSCGAGQADPRVLCYRDGTPIVEGTKVWLAMTVRGGSSIPASHQGIFSLDLTTGDVQYLGAILFDRGDGILRQDHAAHIFYDDAEREWCCIVPTHSDSSRYLRYGTSQDDPRTGGVFVFDTPNYITMPGADSTGWEDGHVIYDEDAAKWRMVATDLDNSTTTTLLEADNWYGPYATVSTGLGNETGQLITKVNGVRYVLAGRNIANPVYGVYSYPDLADLGTLVMDSNAASSRVWPVFIPLYDGHRTRYYLLSFDRGQVAGTYSYGSLYLWEAKERGTGRDYPERRYLP